MFRHDLHGVQWRPIIVGHERNDYYGSAQARRQHGGLDRPVRPTGAQGSSRVCPHGNAHPRRDRHASNQWCHGRARQLHLGRGGRIGLGSHQTADWDIQRNEYVHRCNFSRSSHSHGHSCHICTRDHVREDGYLDRRRLHPLRRRRCNCRECLLALVPRRTNGLYCPHSAGLWRHEQ